MSEENKLTEFTYAPGEKDIVGERFSTSLALFWLKTSVAASSMRVQYRNPNTIFGVIPLGADTQTIPVRNIASVNTSTKFSVGAFLLGLVLGIAGLAMLGSSPAAGIVVFLIGVLFLLNSMKASLAFVNQAGGAQVVTVSILEKKKLMNLGNEIQQRVFADNEALRHAEAMNMQQQQFNMQTQQALMQQQMLQTMQAQQQAPAAQPQAPVAQPQAPQNPAQSA